MTETVDTQAVDTVSIEIDGQIMDAPKGSMIIEAADKAGISIPRFCYHKKLSIAANCRMCLVDVEKAPKPMPACATPVMDGMKVYTHSRRALSSQRNVMEFLLINHPLDCPICDQGGECELQDLSMGYGRSVSRFVERKRVVKDEDLGSLVSTEMTRCIHCTRCVRFLNEIAGTDELGGMGRGDATFISTFINRSIDSELSGNIIDLCPVGALTNKPFRFSARAWELRAQQTVANHDALGSNMYLHTLRGEPMRAVPRDNEAINESWLSDRDRWGFMGLKSDDRAIRPMIKLDGVWQDVQWQQAMESAADCLQSCGARDLAFLLSPRASNEELFLAQAIARALGCANIDHRLRQRDFADDQARGLRPGFELPLAAIAQANAVLLVGSNIRHDQPILGHKVRQAWRNGGQIFAINSRAYDVHFDLAAQCVVKPTVMVEKLAAVAAALKVKAEGELGSLIAAVKPDKATKAIAGGLKQAEQAVLILGDHAVNHTEASWLRALASLVAGATDAKVAELPGGANGAGAWTVGALPHRQAGGKAAATTGRNARQMLSAPAAAYLLYDFEPSLDTALGGDAVDTLAQAGKVVYLGAYASDEIRELADVILPLSVLPECEGSLTNVDGLTQVVNAACAAPEETRPGWKVLRALANLLELEGFDYTRAEQVREQITQAQAEVAPAASTGELAKRSQARDLELLVETPIYGVDGVIRRSDALQRTIHAEQPHVRLSPADAEVLELKEVQRVQVRADAHTVELPLIVDPRIAPGVARIAAGVAGTARLVAAASISVEAEK